MSARRGVGTMDFGGITPLLDTLFILIFSLLAMADTRRSEEEPVRVRLPAVEEGDGAAGPGERIAIEIDAESRVRLIEFDLQVVDRAELDGALGTLLGERVPEEVVIEIRADQMARHGVAVELLQHLRRAGFAQVELLAVGGMDPDGVFGGGVGPGTAEAPR